MSRRDLAVDLGSANTLVYVRGRGVVFDEPTLAAVHGGSGEVLAVGRPARDLAAEHPTEVQVVRPLRRGAITNFDLAAGTLRAILRRVGVGRVARPRALVCVPSTLTTVERRALEEAVASAGARSVTLVDQPVAAAIGAGLPIHEAVGSMVVDVGGGTSEAAMLALGGVTMGKAVPVGGFDMDAALQRHLRERYGLAVGERTAERIKIEAGSAYPAADQEVVRVEGRDLGSGRLRTVPLASEEVREALSGPVRAIVEAARDCLAESPPELAHDVLETGLFLTGGGALLRGLDMLLAHECEVPVHLTERPLRTVVLGAGRLLDYEPEERAALLAAARR
jgi:rod shape-determining protein MreB